MDKSINSNKFYNTFQMFINENSKTADRTINAAKFNKPIVIKRNQKPESFINSATAGGALAVGLAGIYLKRSNLLRLAKTMDVKITRLDLSVQNDFFTKMIKKSFIGIRKVTRKALSITRGIDSKREKFFRNLNDPNNQTILGRVVKRVNNFFINQNIKVTKAKYQKLIKEFDDVEKVLDGRIKVIEESAKGKIEILLPEKVLKVKSEEPIAINLDVMSDGTSRAAKLKEYIAQAKALLQELVDDFSGGSNPRVDKIKTKLTPLEHDLKDKAKIISKNIEYNFENAQNILDRLSLIINNKKVQKPETTKLLQEVSTLLHKYRFDSIADSLTGNDITSRGEYVAALINKLHELSEATKDFDSAKAIKGYVAALKAGMQEEMEHRPLGLMEKIRQLVKCKDLNLDFVKPETNPSCLKHYQTNEYLELKAQIDNFTRKLHKTVKHERYDLPHRLRFIKAGDSILDSALLIAPGAVLTGKELFTNKKDGEKKQPRVLPYWAGAGMFFLTNTLRMVSMPVSILASLLTTLFTTKIQNHFTKE